MSATKGLQAAPLDGTRGGGIPKHNECERSNVAMQPTIESRTSFWVLGIQERADPREVDYSALWGRFEASYAQVEALAVGPNAYGVYFPTDNVADPVDVFAGMAVPPGTDAPNGLVLREVPAGEYAVFECGMADIGETWNRALNDWLPSAPYQADQQTPCFEEFAPGCREGTQPVRVFMALRRAVLTSSTSP